MACASGLLQFLPPNEKIIADGGFRGKAAIMHLFCAAELNDPVRVAHTERIKSSVYKHETQTKFSCVDAAYKIDVVYHPLQV